MPAAPTTQIESRPTVDLARVFVMEDHDQALQVWRSAGAELATVAYSVTGGYTPLQWKWLGDEAALRLRGAGPEVDRRPKVRMGLARASWRIGSRNEAVRHAMASIAAYIAILGQRARKRVVHAWMKIVAMLKMR